VVKKKRRDEGGGSVSDAIMGDLMTQMLTFFILLYTIAAANKSLSESNMDTQALMEIIRDGFRERLELREIAPEPIEKILKPVIQVEEAKVEELDVESKNQIITKIRDVVERETLNKYIEVIIEEKRIRLIFKQPILFNSGFAYLKPGASNYLNPIVNEVLKDIDNEIIIEGHTDSIPIHNDMYADNWELSFDRAYTVLKYMVKKGNINPRRVSAIGYGEYRPRTKNDTKENRSINRRIEVNILLHSEIVKK